MQFTTRQALSAAVLFALLPASAPAAATQPASPARSLTGTIQSATPLTRLVAVDRATQIRTPKPSAYHLGAIAKRERARAKA